MNGHLNFKLLGAAVAAFLLLTSVNALADSERSRDAKDLRQQHKARVHDRRQECRMIGNREAIRRSRAEAIGKVVSVRLLSRGAASVYQIRVLDKNKRMRTLSVPACK